MPKDQPEDQRKDRPESQAAATVLQGEVVSPGGVRQSTPAASTKLLPGMAIIALWMLFEAALGAYGVYAHVFRGQNRYGVLGMATILAGCGLGLIQRRRWGWALSLAMAFFSLCFGSYALMRLHAPQALVITFLNGVFFLYLVRPETRARLR